MEALGVAAASLQLFEYGHSAAKVLLQLIIKIKEGPSIYKARIADIQTTRALVLQISNQLVGTATDNLVKSIIDLSDNALSILRRLSQRSSFISTVLLEPLQRSTISESFDLLETKRDLLHLHLAHDSHRMLSSIKRDIRKLDNPKMSDEPGDKPDSNMGACASRISKVVSNGNNVGEGSTFGAGPTDKSPIHQSDVQSNGNTIKDFGHYRAGPRGENELTDAIKASQANKPQPGNTQGTPLGGGGATNQDPNDNEFQRNVRAQAAMQRIQGRGS